MAKTNENAAPVAQTVENPSNEVIAPANEVITRDSFTEIIDKLIKDKTNRVYRGLIVKNVIKKDTDEDYTRITLVVNAPIPGYIPQDDDTYKRSTTNNVYTTTYAIAAVLKQNEETAMMGNFVVAHPEIVPIILSGATINIIQTDVKEGTEYYNPFTTRDDAEAYLVQHDTIINNIYSLKLGKMGEKYIDKLLDKSVETLLQ